MIHLLFGEDEYSRQEVLASLKEDVNPEEMRELNITELNGREVSFERLAEACYSVPFMASKRLVIVENLLSQFEPRRSGPLTDQPPGLGQWEGLADYLPTVPPSTELVFVDGPLNQRNRPNPLLRKLRPLVNHRSFPLLKGEELRQWIRRRAASQEMVIEPGGVNALADTIGGDLRVISQELEKLFLYRWGETIRDEDVQFAVSYVREANIFATVDAVIEGRAGAAMRLVHQHLESGGAPGQILNMIVRQVRFLLLANDMRQRGVGPAEIGKALSLSGFPLRKTLEQERQFTHEQLAWIHRKLLEADESIKTGEADEQVAIEMLTAELAAARQPATRRRR